MYELQAADVCKRCARSDRSRGAITDVSIGGRLIRIQESIEVAAQGTLEPGFEGPVRANLLLDVQQILLSVAGPVTYGVCKGGARAEVGDSATTSTRRCIVQVRLELP